MRLASVAAALVLSPLGWGEDRRALPEMGAWLHVPSASAAQAAPDAGGSGRSELALDGTEWALELTPIMGGAAGPSHQTLRFNSGRVASSWLESDGYGPADFTAKTREDGVQLWEAMHTRGGEGIVLWRGELHGTSMQGIVSRYFLDKDTRDTRDFSFTGRLIAAPGGAPPPSRASQTVEIRHAFDAVEAGAAVPASAPPLTGALGGESPVWRETLDLLEDRLHQLTALKHRVAELENDRISLNGKIRRLSQDLEAKDGELQRLTWELSQARQQETQAGGQIDTLRAELVARQDDLLKTREVLSVTSGQLKASDSELAALKQEHGVLREQLTGAQETIGELRGVRGENQQLKLELDEVRAQLQRLTSTGVEQAKALETLKAELAAQQTRNNELVDELQGVRTALFNRERELSDAAERERTLRQDYDTVTRDHATLRQEASRLRQTAEQQQRELEQLRASLNDAQQHARTLERTVNELSQSNRLLEQKVQLQQQERDANLREIGRLKERVIQLEDVERGLKLGQQALNEALGEKTQALARTQTDAAKLTRDLSDRDTELDVAYARAAELERQASELSGTLQTREQELRSQLGDRTQALADAEAEVARLRAQQQQRDTELNALRAQNAKLEQRQSELERSLRGNGVALTELQNTHARALADADAEQARLRHELSDRDARIAESERRAAELQRMLQEMDEESGARLEETARALEAAQAELAQIRVQLDERDAMLQSSRADAESAKATLTELEAAVKSKSDALAATEATMATLGEEVARSESALAGAMRTASEAGTAKGDLVARVSELAEGAEELERAKTELARENADLREEFERLKAKLFEMENEREGLHVRLQEAAILHKQLEDEVERQRRAMGSQPDAAREADQLRRENAQLRTRRGELEARTEQLESKLEEAIRQNRHLVEEMELMKLGREGSPRAIPSKPEMSAPVSATPAAPAGGRLQREQNFDLPQPTRRR